MLRDTKMSTRVILIWVSVMVGDQAYSVWALKFTLEDWP